MMAFLATRKIDMKVYIAGHKGMVGSAIWRQLEGREGVECIGRSRDELDLIDQQGVDAFFARERPTQVYIAAAKVGGIHANSHYPADFIYENLIVACNIIASAHRHGVERLLFLGSSCIYPRLAPQPMAEEALLTGTLEPTNEPYAVAKIAGIKLCESYHRQHGADFRSVMPTNLYGPGDNYHPRDSHVIPALMRRFHEARQSGAERVTIWGSGQPRREFLHVDDMAAACVHVMDLPRSRYDEITTPQQAHLNVGYGSDVTIAELAQLMAKITGYEGKIVFDSSQPDGAPRKLIDSAKLRALGWQPGITLADGLAATYADFAADPDFRHRR